MDDLSGKRVLRRRLTGLLALLSFCWLMKTYPALDLLSSAAFFDSTTGEFLLQTNYWSSTFLDLLQAAGRMFPIVVLMILIAASISSAVARSVPRRDLLVYLLLASVLVPGVLVNGLKIHYGRARPQHVQQFGGPSLFTPALVVSDQCTKNCSFVSGDAAVGFVPLALALVARRRRQLLIYAALCFGIAVAATKVMQGRHFMSDVVIASVLTAGLNYELYLLLTKRRLAAVHPPLSSVNSAPQ